MRIFYGAAHEQFPPSAALRHSTLADPGVHVEKLKQLVEMGATTIAVMNCSGADPEGAIRVYGEHVLPKLR